MSEQGSAQPWRICFMWREQDAYEVEIVLGKRSITPDTALRLARYFGTSERFWLGLQADFDLEEAKLNLAGQIEREITPRKSTVAG
jgi:plasmid maintenance system antidote protein VapI